MLYPVDDITEFYCITNSDCIDVDRFHLGAERIARGFMYISHRRVRRSSFRPPLRNSAAIFGRRILAANGRRRRSPLSTSLGRPAATLRSPAAPKPSTNHGGTISRPVGAKEAAVYLEDDQRFDAVQLVLVETV